MYRMLIVDDEPEIVESLYELLNEADIPQLEIYKTYSSREAVTIINNLKLDILMTDIRMPGVNGFQLAEMSKKNWPKSRIIFLTGHNEFDYAYKVIKDGYQDYLLKTESNKTIIDVIRKTIIKIEESFQDDELMSKAKNQMKIFTPILQREYILDIIETSLKSSEFTQEKLKELEIPLSLNMNIFVLFCRMDEVSKENIYRLSKPEYLIALRVVMEEALSRYSNHILVEYDNNSFLCLIQSITNPEKDNDETEKKVNEEVAIIKGTVETIQNICSKSLNTTVSFAMCNAPIEWKLINEKVQLLKKVLNYSTGIVSEAFLTDKSFSINTNKKINSRERDLHKNGNLNLRNINILEDYLDRGLKDKFFNHLSTIIDDIRNIKNRNNNLAMQIYYSVSSCLLAYINRHMIEEEIALKLDLFKLTRVDMHNSWDEAVEYIYILSTEIFSIQKFNQNEAISTSIKQVQQYIEKHLNEDLSLDRLANLVYFNPSYLSRLFKKETGTNISEYIIKSRIIKAKELFVLTDLKVSEIAQRVGIESPDYFARIFKKATDMTPHEFRDSSHKR